MLAEHVQSHFLIFIGDALSFESQLQLIVPDRIGIKHTSHLLRRKGSNLPIEFLLFQVTHTATSLYM